MLASTIFSGLSPRANFPSTVFSKRGVYGGEIGVAAFGDVEEHFTGSRGLRDGFKDQDWERLLHLDLGERVASG